MRKGTNSERKSSLSEESAWNFDRATARVSFPAKVSGLSLGADEVTHVFLLQDIGRLEERVLRVIVVLPLRDMVFVVEIV